MRHYGKMEVREISIDKKYDCKKMLGNFLSEDDADVLIENEAVNIYGPKGIGQTENDESNLICGLRPKVFNPQEILDAYEGLGAGATETTNRGQSAGNDDSGIAHRRREIVGGSDDAIIRWIIDSGASLEELTLDVINDQWEQFRVLESKGILKSKQKQNRGTTWQRKKMDEDGYENIHGEDLLKQTIEGLKGLSNHEKAEKIKEFRKWYISMTETAFPVLSGIGGYYGRYPRIPYCRTTNYTANDVERWKKCLHYINRVDDYFAELLPNRYASQKRAAESIDPELRIGDTAFTTVTINSNFRTACHRDAGDWHEGFGNLSCTGKGEWDGGYTIFPEFRAGVKLNPGDVLIADVHEIHGNTAIREKGTGREAIFTGNKQNKEKIVDFERISLVCYLRRNMTECGSRVYEDLRKQFTIDMMEDKTRPEHSLYTHKSQMWNGVFPGMWESEEWIHYLRSHGFDQEADQINPPINTLDEFF